jgi:probable rRNA maturation factor
MVAGGRGSFEWCMAVTAAISIVNQTRHKIDAPWIKRNLLLAAKALGIKQMEWAIAIVGDRAMGKLHGRTMGDPETTDVLTFDLREAAAIKRTKEGAPVELDTVVCADEAGRRTKEMGHSLREELLLYAVHSLLHVQGYDDVTAKGAARMHRREDEVLIGLGVGPVYSRAGGERSGTTA